MIALTRYEDFLLTLKSRKYDPASESIGITDEIANKVLTAAEKDRWNFKWRKGKLVFQG